MNAEQRTSNKKSSGKPPKERTDMAPEIVEEHDMEIQDAVEAMAERITTLFKETFAALIAQRDGEYEAGIASLNAERERLIEEQAELDSTAENLEAVLPARARESQREADRLLLDGKQEEAQLKLAEAQTAAEAPAAMRERMRVINERLLDIDVEKRKVAHNVYRKWFDSLGPVVRAGERGLFLILLDGIEIDAHDFQNRNGSATVDTFGTMFSSLIGHERSAEWASGQKWYRVRTR